VLQSRTWQGQTCQENKYAKKMAQKDPAPRTLSHVSQMAQGAQEDQVVIHGSCLSHAKRHRYIGGLMGRPLWTSMVNSQYRSYTLRSSYNFATPSVTCPLLLHPYPKGIQALVLTITKRTSKARNIYLSTLGNMTDRSSYLSRLSAGPV
jgi:hypothetical protein